MLFRSKQSIDYNSAEKKAEAARYFHIENECACFHTGLYTERYKAIYAFFDRNKRRDSMLDWYFRGFCDEVSPRLKYIEPLPERPHYHVAGRSDSFNPDWPIRVKVEHILGDEETDTCGKGFFKSGGGNRTVQSQQKKVLPIDKGRKAAWVYRPLRQPQADYQRRV